MLVLSAIDNGMRVDDAATVFSVGRSTIFGWIKLREEGGPDALTVKMPPGPKAALNDQQLAQLRGWIVGRDPRQLQFDFGLWTREMVAELIKRKFGVEFTLQWVGKLLARLGLSPQKPLVRAYEQNPERVRRWKEEEYPKIRAQAIGQGAGIYFLDEASVRTNHHAGTTWGTVGDTPVVRGTGQRHSVNMISVVNTQGKLHFSFVGTIDSAAFIEYLKTLLHDIPGKIFLILDGHPAHRSAETKAFVKSTKGRLRIFFLPPYSPELNPDEWVWKSIKHDRVGRAIVRSVDELTDRIEQAVDRLQATPELVRSFFRDRDLLYITAPVTELRSSSPVSA
ncbi:IS630 family transposase [Nonomuraea sp. NPDC050153]|uniref:IS630 family transposase n=1 Tax=Nonomuraea sp. NPDC050153 TaxID=3364359 RepID=UPI0037BDEC3C